MNYGIIFDRTHDLVALAALGAAHSNALPVDDDQLRLLNSYAVKFRYESCAAAMVNADSMQSLVESLRKWSTNLTATTPWSARGSNRHGLRLASRRAASADLSRAR